MNDLDLHPKAHFAGATHVGQTRRSNQDNYLIADMLQLLKVCDSSVNALDGQSVVSNPPGSLLILADGMGGHADGEYASQTAIRYMTDFVANLLPQLQAGDQHDDKAFLDALKQSPVEIHNLLRKEGLENPARADMGTTLTTAIIVWPTLYVVHVGDTRCYLLRDGRMKQLTTDHTIAQYLADAGQTTSDRSLDGSLHHVLWNAVSAAQKPPEPQVNRHLLELDDYVLLCSDGLTRHLTTNEIADVLRSEKSVTEKAGELINETNRRGGRDNISVVIGHFESGPDTTDVCLVSEPFRECDSLSDTDIDIPILTLKSLP